MVRGQVVFPTLVGVFPTLVGVFRLDLPDTIGGLTYSPRWWGCSVDEVALKLGSVSIPHAGGGVPELGKKTMTNTRVFPTLVGVFR